MGGFIDPLLFALSFGGIVVGIYSERWRARLVRREWQATRAARPGGKTANVYRFGTQAPSAITDSAEQLRLVMATSFATRPLLSMAEARVFYAAEKAVKDAGLRGRVMAQVCLGEILTCKDRRAFSAINSKRVDLLVISNSGQPLAAIEYQGEGHYQGTAPARDAVKKEALRKAGVRYIEVTPEHGPADIAREIARIAKVGQLKRTG